MKPKIIMLMVAMIIAISSSTVSGKVLYEGTIVPVVLTQNISSKTLKKDAVLPLAISQDIYDEDTQLIIPEGTPVEALITKAQKRGVWGRKGIIEFQPTAIDLNETKIPITSPAIKKEGRSRKGAATGWFCGLIIYFPLNFIAPLCIKGEDCMLEAGTVFNVTVSQDIVF